MLTKCNILLPVVNKIMVHAVSIYTEIMCHWKNQMQENTCVLGKVKNKLRCLGGKIIILTVTLTPL